MAPSLLLPPTSCISILVVAVATVAPLAAAPGKKVYNQSSCAASTIHYFLLLLKWMHFWCQSPPHVHCSCPLAPPPSLVIPPRFCPLTTVQAYLPIPGLESLSPLLQKFILFLVALHLAVLVYYIVCARLACPPASASPTSCCPFCRCCSCFQQRTPSSRSLMNPARTSRLQPAFCALG